MISPPLNSTIFRLLCRVLGGQSPRAFDECIAAGRLPELFGMAYKYDVLPGLAVRCNEQPVDGQFLGDENTGLLKQALMDIIPKLFLKYPLLKQLTLLSVTGHPNIILCLMLLT